MQNIFKIFFNIFQTKCISSVLDVLITNIDEIRYVYYLLPLTAVEQNNLLLKKFIRFDVYSIS